MIPFELEPRVLPLPSDGEPTIVIATGVEPRHHRFALRIQQEFGSRVIACYQLEPRNRAPPPASPLRRAARFARRLLGRGTPVASPSLFAAEVEELRRHAVVKSRVIAADAIHGAEFLQEIVSLRPFFFLTLGGGLYRGEVLEAVRGVAINQHAGFAPDLKGNQTILQALYHRDLRRVASTVHLTTTAADAGPILRRSNPCLAPSDDPARIVERVVALGTELMIECVREIITTGRILVFDQPLTGLTYLARDCDGHVRAAVAGDFARGWLREALRRRLSW